MSKIIAILLMLPLLCSGKEHQNRLPQKPESKICNPPCAIWKEKDKAEFNKRYKAFKVGMPYHAKEEKDVMKNNLAHFESEYKKRFGVPISDFELSITHINFYIGVRENIGIHHFSGFSFSSFSVTRTAIGAFVEYKPDGYTAPLKLELNMGEWLDFIRTLYKYRINEWKKEYDGYYGNVYRDAEQWKLEIYYLGKDESNAFYGINPGFRHTEWEDAFPPNWDEFKKTINGIKMKIKKEAVIKMEPELKVKYKKRFGVPISDFELSAMRINFYTSGNCRCRTYFSVTRTATGGYIEYKPCDSDLLKVSLDMNEWLDFIRTLYKNRINEWKKSYGEDFDPLGLDPKCMWALEIYSLDEILLMSSGDDIYPPNWKMFVKTIDDMKAKARKKAGNEQD